MSDEETSLKVDVAVIGCSQTLGWGVQDNEAYPSLVADRLSREVLNLGVSGYSSIQAFRRLLTFNAITPDLPMQRPTPAVVIYGFWHDHLRRNINPFLEDNKAIRVRRPYLISSKQWRFVEREPRRTMVAFRSGRVSSLRAPESWLRLREMRLARRLAATDLCDAAYFNIASYRSCFPDSHLIIVWIPDYLSGLPPQAMPKDLRNRVMRLPDTSVVDVSEPFSKLQFVDLVAVQGVDHHMGRLAHEICAEAIVNRMVAG